MTARSCKRCIRWKHPRRATLDTLKAAASAAGEAFGEALGAVAAPVALGDEGELARRAVQLAEAVTRAWSGTAAFDAPALSIAFGAIDPSALLEGVLSGLQAAFSAASETLRAAVEEGYLRPGFEGVDWEALAGQLSARMSAVGTQGAQALAATAPTLRAAAATAASGVGEAMDASGAASVAGRADRGRLDVGFQQPRGKHESGGKERCKGDHGGVQWRNGDRFAVQSVHARWPLHWRRVYPRL